MSYAGLLQAAVVLFAVVNPIGSIPVFLQLTGHLDRRARHAAFGTAVLTAAIILFLFVCAGHGLLARLFRIEMSDLTAAGGLLLLIIAIDHLVFGALVRRVLQTTEQDPRHIGAVPIACPILAGPGAMITVLLTVSEHGVLCAVLSIVLVLGATLMLLTFIERIYRLLGEIVCLVLSKILCLFLAAIGIRMLMTGITYYF